MLDNRKKIANNEKIFDIYFIFLDFHILYACEYMIIID